jgi:hypothetical protein
MVLFEKKRKLLFSFAPNMVKMCGFVEPAQWISSRGRNQASDFPELIIKSTGYT